MKKHEHQASQESATGEELAKRKATMRVKLALMGGSIADSILRIFTVLFTIVIFTYFLVSVNYAHHRDEKVIDCFVSDTSEFTAAKYSDDKHENRNITKQWRKLYYFTILVQLLTFVQVGVAMWSYNTKRRFRLLDRVSFTLTIVNLLAQASAFIWMHVARWSHGGRVCSGDYLSSELYEVYYNDDLANDYLLKEGNFLKWWIIVNWILFFTMLCCLCTCIFTLKKLRSNLHSGASLND